MSTQETRYGLSSKGRLEVLQEGIVEGLLRGEDAKVLDAWFSEAKVESARLAGEEALRAGQKTIIIDSLEVPSAFSALVRQMEGVRADWIAEIAGVFENERDFTDAMDVAMSGGDVDPRLSQLSVRFVEERPRNDLHGLREGSSPEVHGAVAD